MFYMFSASNRQTLYGWTQDREVMLMMLNRLNRKTGEFNQYRATALGDGEDVVDDQGRRLSERDDLILTDDTTVGDIEDLNERDNIHSTK